MNNCYAKEKTIMDLIELLKKEKGHSIPTTVNEISGIPFSTFERLQSALLSQKILIQRFSFNYSREVFQILANSAEQFFSKFYIWLSVGGPVLSVILCFFHSWWWFMGILIFPVGMSKNKKIYNKVIYASAVQSEIIFCFLYYIGQISLSYPDYHITYYWGQKTKKSFSSKQNVSENLSSFETVKNIIKQDAEIISRGEIPETHLIPHHAIKRDVILYAYNKDFQSIVKQVNSMDWIDAEKKQRIADIKNDFDKKIYGIKRFKVADLDSLIELMKKTRTDFKEIEQEVRSKNSMYKIVEPLLKIAQENVYDHDQPASDDKINFNNHNPQNITPKQNNSSVDAAVVAGWFLFIFLVFLILIIAIIVGYYY